MARSELDKVRIAAAAEAGARRALRRRRTEGYRGSFLRRLRRPEPLGMKKKVLATVVFYREV